MATTYILKTAASDLSGGVHFNNELSTGTETPGSLSPSITKASTEDSYGFTVAGEPGASGTTGDYTVEVNVTTGNTSIEISTAIHRVNSAGTFQAEGAASTEQTAAGGLLTFTHTAINLGTWAAGDRLRVVYRFRNTHAHSAQAFTMETGTTDAEVVAPWTVGAPVTVTPGTGTATWTGFAPTASVSNNQTVTPGVGAGTWTGLAPTATGGAGLTVTPGVGQGTWTGLSPTVTATANQTVTPGVGEATWSGFAPTATGGSGLTVRPGVGQANWTGFAPAVSVTDHQTVSPAVGQATWSGFAPAATTSDQAAEPAAPITYSVTRSDVDLSTIYAKVQLGWTQGPPLRVRFEDGKPVEEVSQVEEFGTPKQAEPTPVAEAPAPVRAKAVPAKGPRGRTGLGVSRPKAKPAPVEARPTRRPLPVSDDEDDLAMTALMEALAESAY